MKIRLIIFCGKEFSGKTKTFFLVLIKEIESDIRIVV